MDFKKLPFFLLGAAIIGMKVFSLIGFSHGLFLLLAEPPIQDIETGTIELLFSLMWFIAFAFLLNRVVSVYMRVFPKQNKTEQEVGE